MSCNKDIYLKLPLSFGCGCNDDQGCHDDHGHDCGGHGDSGAQHDCCEAINEMITELTERVNTLEGKQIRIATDQEAAEGILENVAINPKQLQQYACKCKPCGCENGGEDGGTKPIIGEPVGVILPESGVKADKTLYRVDKNIENVDAIQAGYFDNHSVWRGIVHEEIDGQTMIKVPAFAYKRAIATSGSNIGKKYLMLAPADTTEPGFVRHPAFMKDGQPIEQFWVGAYQGCADTLDASKLGSQAGTKPLTNVNRAGFRTRAYNRNIGGLDGFMVWSFYQLAAIQMLYLVEYANPDSQSAIATGKATNASGLTAVDDPGLAAAKYRGITGLWNGIYQFVDGIRTDSAKKAEIWDRSGTKNYITTSFTIPTNQAFVYMSSLESSNGAGYDFNDVFLPNKVSNSASAALFPDMFYGAISNGTCGFGGTHSSINDAGLFSMVFHQPASFVYAYAGTRLAKI